MGEAADQIVDEIEQGRKALDRDLNALERRIRRETDWKLQLRKHPWLAIASAIVLGYVVVLITFMVQAASQMQSAEREM
jgi:hypothetical protein